MFSVWVSEIHFLDLKCKMSMFDNQKIIGLWWHHQYYCIFQWFCNVLFLGACSKPEKLSFLIASRGKMILRNRGCLMLLDPRSSLWTISLTFFKILLGKYVISWFFKAFWTNTLRLRKVHTYTTRADSLIADVGTSLVHWNIAKKCIKVSLNVINGR